MPQRERTIRVDLCRRHLGRHEMFRRADVPLAFESVVSVGTSGETTIDEDALLAALPARFLTADPSAVLLLVDESAVRQPKRFRAWGKYFDSLSLFVYAVDPDEVES